MKLIVDASFDAERLFTEEGAVESLQLHAYRIVPYAPDFVPIEDVNVMLRALVPALAALKTDQVRPLALDVAFQLVDEAPCNRTDRKNNPSIDIVAGESVWSLSGSMSAREQTVRGRDAAIWSRQS